MAIAEPSGFSPIGKLCLYWQAHSLTYFFFSCIEESSRSSSEYVTDNVLEQLVCYKFPLKEHSMEDEGDLNSTITYEEGNALRYVSGYICRSVHKNLISHMCKHPRKKDLIICVDDLTTDEQDGLFDETETWMNLLDRGGLVHVKDETYNVFHAMEEEVRNHLRSLSCELPTSKIVEKICEKNDIQFYWSIVTVESEETISQELLKIVAEKFTLRGFAFTSTWMEQYKLSTKKSIQRSKALRREITDASKHDIN